ncbi:hypothetical protein C0J52_17720 [Blattella germanica]|nr:hypothetical protein C0J52_17720 [Blattella germanica]
MKESTLFMLVVLAVAIITVQAQSSTGGQEKPQGEISVLQIRGYRPISSRGVAAGGSLILDSEERAKRTDTSRGGIGA